MKSEELENQYGRWQQSWSGFWRLGLAMTFGAVAGWLCSQGCVPARRSLDYSLLAQAWAIIENNYVDRSAVKSMPATYGAISGMVESLGDSGHSAFMSPEMIKEFGTTLSGEFKGIGLEIQEREGHVLIVTPIDGSPAQRAGLRSHEVILKVAGQDVSGWPMTKVVGMVSGPPGTTVTLTVLSPRTGRIREVTVTRATIKMHNVTWRRLPGGNLFHLRISRFDAGVAMDFAGALDEILRQHPGGIILDLRNNPGGMFADGVQVASQFLDGGNVLQVKDARGHIRPVPVKPGGKVLKVPLVVLVNEGSASAAEIVAGALLDRHRALLVGETTFGTGTVLGEFHLADGSALLLAVEEWLTPDGHSFWHQGITPNHRVALSDEAEPLVPDTEDDMTAAQIQASSDRQLLDAMKVLGEHQGMPQVGEQRP